LQTKVPFPKKHALSSSSNLQIKQPWPANSTGFTHLKAELKDAEEYFKD